MQMIYFKYLYVLLQDAQVGMALPFSKHLGQCSYINHGINLLYQANENQCYL